MNVYEHGSIPWQNNTAPHVLFDNSLANTLVGVCSALSIAGSMFVFCTWFRFKKLQYFSRKLVVFVSVADFASSLSLFFGTFVRIYEDNHRPSKWCFVQGMMVQFFSLASIMWTGCFAFYMNQTLINNSRSRCEFGFHLVAWGVPAATCVYLGLGQYYGTNIFNRTNQAWCWIDNAPSERLRRDPALSFDQYVLFYVPEVLIFVLNASFYSVLIRRIDGSSLGRQMSRRLSLYLCAFLVPALPSFAHQVYRSCSNSQLPSTAFILTESFFKPLQGFINALAYGMSKQIIERCF
jgi:hypothetical protein